METQKIKNIVLSTLAASLIVGCSGGGSSSSSTTASGGAQKGPFKSGQMVTAQKLTATGNKDNTVLVKTTLTDSLGKFSFSSIPWSGATEFTVVGEYLDESAGEYVTGGLLSAITDVKEGTAPKVNINILTHIAAANIKDQMSKNISISNAKEKAKEDISKAFKIDLSDDSDLEDLDITAGKDETNKAANTQLLKLSAALTSTVNPTETLNSLVEDLEDGEIDDEAESAFEDLKEKQSEVNLDEVSRNIKSAIESSDKTALNDLATSEDVLDGTLSLNNNIEFIDVLETEINTSYESNKIVIDGILGTKETTISIINGEFSINDNEFSSNATTINNGDILQLKANSSSSFDTKTETTLVLGGINFSFNLVTRSDTSVADTKIKAFEFISKTEQNLNSDVTSEVVIIDGIDTVTNVSIDNGTLEISTDNGNNWQTGIKQVNKDDQIRVKHTTSSEFGTRIKSIVTFGNEEDESDHVIAEFKSYTSQQDQTPNIINFSTQYDQSLSSDVDFDEITISGITGDVEITIDNGEYSLDSGTTWTNENGIINDGNTLKVKHESSEENNTKTTSKLTIGTRILEFSSFTVPETDAVDLMPKEFKFAKLFEQELSSDDSNEYILSEEITIEGINEEAEISVEDGEYSLDSGSSWTSEEGTISNEDTLILRHVSSKENLEKTQTKVQVGDYETKFTSFTKAAVDTIPNQFGFEIQNSVDISSVTESKTQYIRGINTQTDISIENGEFSIDEGTTWLMSSTISNDTPVIVRHTSSSENDTKIESVLTIGNDTDGKFTTKFISITKKAAPVFTNETAIKIEVYNGSLYKYTPSVNDAEEFEIENKPSWLTFNTKTGTLEGTPNDKELEGIYENIAITAKNDGGETELDTFNITVKNITPSITLSSKSLTKSIYNDLSIDITTNDIEGEMFTYELIDAPIFIDISETGKITNSSDLVKGNYTFKVRVIDSSDASVEETITLNVVEFSDTPTLPEISGTAITSIAEDEVYSFIPSASDINSTELVFSIENKPEWASFNASTGELNGTPTNDNVGTYENIIISVTEANDKVSLASFDIEVTNSNDAPTSSNQSFNLDSSTSLTLNGTLTGSDIDVGDTITFEFGPINGGTLTSNPDGTFTYTTDEGFIGTDTFGFSVKDSAGASSQMYTASINVTDGSLPLNKDVDDAIEKIKSIDPETENIDVKLNEAKDLLNENTTPEAEIVRLSISLAEIANDDDIASLLNLDDGPAIGSLSTLNTIVRSTVMNTVNVSVKDDATNLSSVSTQKLNKIADELKKISDEFGNLFTSSDDVYTYDGENMDYNDSLALRASILGISAQLKQQSSYQWGSNADIEIRDYEGNEYRNINVDLAAVLNEGTVYKLTSDASSRLLEAKAFLSQAADLLLELPLGYDGDIEDEETGLTQEDKDEITSIKLSLAGTTAYTLEVDDEDIKEVKVDLSKMYDVATALDITSFGTNWQNVCYEGDIISVEEAKIEGTLDCKVIDYSYFDGQNYPYYWYESSEAEPQTMPTAANSKIDDIVLSITKIDNTILTGQEMIDFVLEDETKVEALGTTWGNSKYSSDYLVNGNDVKVSEEYGTLKVNAYKAEGIASKAQAKKNFSTPKSEIKAKIRLRDVDEVDSTTSRGSFQAVMNNINSADERIYAHIQLRNNRIQYYVGRYDSTGNTEAEDYTDYTNGNHKFAETSTANDDASVKFAVSIATSGADIIFNVSKVDGSGTVIENYDEKVITTDSSFDLGIDEARFRAEVRLSDDDGTLYDQIITPTKLRVHSFSTVNAYPIASLATLSVGDTAILTGKNPWYDIMTVNNGSITLKMYDNDDGTYAYSESETFTTDLTTTSSTFNITQAGEEGSAEIMNTVQVGENLFKSDIKFTNTVETNESDTWGWDDHGATTIDQLVTLFTNGNTYFQTANTTFMLKSNGIVAKGMFSGSDEYGDHFSYGAEVSTASWKKEDGKIKVNLSTDYKVLMSFELNSSNDIVESEINQIGYEDSDYLYTGSGALQYFENQTGINPND